MNPYSQFVSEFSRLVTEGKSLPLGGIPPHHKPAPPPGAPAVLIFAPHPDDECIVGGYALRLMREAGMRVTNVAVTLGTNKERQQPRLEELRKACQWLGFGLELAAPRGLEKITLQGRAQEPERWAASVKTIAGLLAKYQPRFILFPHAGDFHATHIGTNYLVMDALKTMPPGFQCCLVETEFWAPLPAPNLMVELGADDVADLLAAVSFHVGEVQRNPYHLRMPAWLQDNVRRGAEVVGGQGGAAPDFMFATLYRLRQWKNSQVEDVYAGGRNIGVKDSPAI